jgi:hypothetical protein
MSTIFRPEELITKNGKKYPVVGGRLRVAHDDNEQISIRTELVKFQPLDLAVVNVKISTTKGEFTAYGVASASKDARLIDSLLELAETRAIARALRFAGYGVEYTGMEEIGDQPVQIPTPKIQQVYPEQGKSAAFAPNNPQATSELITKPQFHAIHRIAQARKWDAVECCRRILKEPGLQDLDQISKKQAIEVIGRMKAAAA